MYTSSAAGIGGRWAESGEKTWIDSGRSMVEPATKYLTNNKLTLLL